jgi:hypothetical protein
MLKAKNPERGHNPPPPLLALPRGIIFYEKMPKKALKKTSETIK